MGVGMATVQVCAPFFGLEGYKQVNCSPSLNVTFITPDVVS
jgi:hypothetical protein